MVIVCATDDNFIQHCCVMLVSLLMNNRNVDIYILTEGLKPENQKIIEEEVANYDGKLHFCLVDSSVVEKFPMPSLPGLSHISRATYYRLLIADLLPQDVHKAIYLDCDIIVNGSLQELWDTDMTGWALAASLQVGFGYEAVRIGYPVEYGYFNAGVNVINVDYFREHNVSAQLLDYIRDNYSRIKFHDQDTLNAVLFDKTLHLMPQWNMTSVAYAYQLGRYGDRVNGRLVNGYEKEKANIKKYRKHPIVLHYVSKPKPWQNGCVHPLYHLYYDYARHTTHFSEIKPQNPFSRCCAVVKDKIRARLSAVKQMIVRRDKTRY